MSTSRRLVAIGLAAITVLAACGGDDGPDEVEAGGAVAALAGGAEGIYVGSYGGRVELRDAGDGDVIVTKTLDTDVTGLAVAGDALFATMEGADLIVRVDASTLDEEARTVIESVGGMSVAVGPVAATETVVVVGDFDNVVILDPDTLEQLGRTDDLAGPVRAVAVAGDSAYAITSGGILYRLDAATAETVTQREVPDATIDECGLAADADGVWVAGTQSAGHYDAATLDSLGDVDVEHSQAVIATDGGGALLRAETSEGSEVLTVVADGAIEGRTDIPGGGCLVRGGESDKVWGRATGDLVAVDPD